MEEEIKIGFVLDNYKLKRINYYFSEAMQLPEFVKRYPNMLDYMVVKTEKSAGPTPNTTAVIRTYRLKKGVK